MAPPRQLWLNQSELIALSRLANGEDMLSHLRQEEQVTSAVISDAALVCAAQAGDSVAFVHLCERHSHKLFRRVNRITRNWHDAEDALQDAWLNAFRNLNRFENRSAFSSWITSISINSGLMTLRRKHRVTISLDETLDYVSNIGEVPKLQSGMSPERLCEARELRSLLSAAIEHLPTKLRVVTQLRIVQEHSTREIAAHLGLSESAVKSRLSRGRILLRKRFAHAMRTAPRDVIGTGAQSRSRSSVTAPGKSLEKLPEAA